jgi:hypothetical protein
MTENPEKTPLLHSVQRIGTSEKNDGYFLINDSVQVQYVETDGEITMNLNYNEEDITEQEAYDLAAELLKQTFKLYENDNNVSE